MDEIASTGLCCARQPDGRALFVQAVPLDLQEGVLLRCTLHGVSLIATVSIPPALLLHVDPTIALASFDAVISEPATVESPLVAGVPLELLLWEGGAPSPEMVSRMLSIAYSEWGRLDDPGEYPERKHGDARSSERHGRRRRR